MTDIDALIVRADTLANAVKRNRVNGTSPFPLHFHPKAYNVFRRCLLEGRCLAEQDASCLDLLQGYELPYYDTTLTMVPPEELQQAMTTNRGTNKAKGKPKGKAKATANVEADNASKISVKKVGTTAKKRKLQPSVPTTGDDACVQPKKRGRPPKSKNNSLECMANVSLSSSSSSGATDSSSGSSYVHPLDNDCENMSVFGFDIDELEYEQYEHQD
jgi:hypothetical protein